MQGAEHSWWKFSDFGSGAGDIKTVWEASRLDWVLAVAQQARCGDAAALGRLNAWLADWVRHNPAYRGPNWKCGQEAAIWVVHPLLAARLLGQMEEPQPDLAQLVEPQLAFAEKVIDIVGLYMNPPDNALILSVDEKTQIQALDRTQPGLPLNPGCIGSRTHDYKPNGTVALYAAYDILTGTVIG